jgi:hypothetical protein
MNQWQSVSVTLLGSNRRFSRTKLQISISLETSKVFLMVLGAALVHATLNALVKADGAVQVETRRCRPPVEQGDGTLENEACPLIAPYKCPGPNPP